MTDALSWFRSFLEIKWAAVTTYHLEADEDAFEVATDAYKALKDEDVGEALNRTR